MQRIKKTKEKNIYLGLDIDCEDFFFDEVNIYETLVTDADIEDCEKLNQGVYIDKIYIFDSSTEKMTVNVETHIKDAIDRTWSASAISEHIKYLVVISANSDLNSTITQAGV